PLRGLKEPADDPRGVLRESRAEGFGLDTPVLLPAVRGPLREVLKDCVLVAMAPVDPDGGPDVLRIPPFLFGGVDLEGLAPLDRPALQFLDVVGEFTVIRSRGPGR